MSANPYDSDAVLRKVRIEIERLKKSTREIQRIMQAEIDKSRTVASELETSYQNSAELCLTYHGELERAKAEIAHLRSTPVARVVEAARELLTPRGDNQMAIHEHGIEAAAKLKQALAEYDAAGDNGTATTTVITSGLVERARIVALIKNIIANEYITEREAITYRDIIDRIEEGEYATSEHS